MRPLVSEPSVIHARNVDSSLLRYAPSSISAFSVDGSTSDTRTFRDSGPQRGRFRFGLRTVRDTCLQRGWFTRLTLNHPRYQSPAWTVHPLIPEPSVIQAQNVDGSLLRYEPSVISALSMDGSPIDIEPSAILILSVDGSALDSEPSAIHAFSVDGSPD